MNESATITRTGKKFDQVLDGAREVFMADGFEGASMDDIARAAGVSKATVYSYFPDKRQLFIEMARTACVRMADETVSRVEGGEQSMSELLTLVAREIIHFLTSPFGLQIFRICVAESDRFPELGRAFYKNGPEQGRARLVEFFSQAVADGKLDIDDLDFAADQFSELCKARVWPRAVFGVQSKFSDEEIDLCARNAAQTFLARYGPKPQA